MYTSVNVASGRDVYKGRDGHQAQPRRGPDPRAARREQLLRAAAAAFLTAGYEKTSMEDVAKAAGVTRLIVYRIFESKEALYLAVIAAVLDDIVEQFEPRPQPMPVAERSSIAAMLLGVARRQPTASGLLWRHTSNQPEFHELFTSVQERDDGVRGRLDQGDLEQPRDRSLGRRVSGQPPLREHLPVARQR